MVAKKRTNLRTKIQAKSSHPGPSQTQQEQPVLPADPLAFLHEHKQTKRDKLNTKRDKLLTKLQSDSANISKSSLRRRKRKAKEELLPKMKDLLTALDEEPVETENANRNEVLKNVNLVPSQRFVSKNPKNIPNPRNKTGVKLIENQERARFGEVLKDEKFKTSPFAALRQSINARLQNSS